MNYKKETMCNEVEELISKYKLLQTEIAIFSNDIVSVKKVEQFTKQLANNFTTDILIYIKKYRKTAHPNLYFIKQIAKLLF
jgi:conjugal transfer/entry exclusion protein